MAAATGRRDAALAALDAIPATSRAYGESRRKRAVLLAAAGLSSTVGDLDAAAAELEVAALDDAQRAALRVQILESALQLAIAAPRGALATSSVGGVPVAETPLRTALEGAYRESARHQTDRRERVRLVDLANQVRARTLV